MRAGLFSVCFRASTELGPGDTVAYEVLEASTSSTMTIPVSLIGASDQETDDSLRGLGGHDDCRYSESSQTIAPTEVPGTINEEGTKGCRADPIDTSSAHGGYS